MVLHRLHDLPIAVEADDLGQRSDSEDLARLKGAMELGKVTIWFAMDSARTPLPGAPLSTKSGRQSTEGYTHGSR